MTPSPFFIAVTGGSASGKSRLAHVLSEHFGEKGGYVIPEDDYYVDAGNMPGFDERRFNFDEPAAKAHPLLVEHLEALRSGESIESPVYDFTTHCRSTHTTHRKPARFIVVEGLHVLASPALRACFDLTVFVHASDAIRLQRRIDRDVAERSRTAEFARHQFESLVRPMHDLHIEPQRDLADILIDNVGEPDFDRLARPVLNRMHAAMSG